MYPYNLFDSTGMLQTVSEKIKIFSLKNSTNDQTSEMFFEKEKYGLAFLTAYIIKNLTFPDKSKKAFLSKIEDYNSNNGKHLTFEEFEKIYWIRIIKNEVIISDTILSAYNKNENS